MRSKLFIYAFVFMLMLVIFQYVNSKHIFESYQQKMEKHIEREKILKDSIVQLNHLLESKILIKDE